MAYRWGNITEVRDVSQFLDLVMPCYARDRGKKNMGSWVRPMLAPHLWQWKQRRSLDGTFNHASIVGKLGGSREYGGGQGCGVGTTGTMEYL